MCVPLVCTWNIWLHFGCRCPENMQIISIIYCIQRIPYSRQISITTVCQTALIKKRRFKNNLGQFSLKIGENIKTARGLNLLIKL